MSPNRISSFRGRCCPPAFSSTALDSEVARELSVQRAVRFIGTEPCRQLSKVKIHTLRGNWGNWHCGGPFPWSSELGDTAKSSPPSTRVNSELVADMASTRVSSELVADTADLVPLSVSISEDELSESVTSSTAARRSAATLRRLSARSPDGSNLDSCGARGASKGSPRLLSERRVEWLSMCACTSLASGCSREDPKPSVPRCDVCRSSVSSSKVVGRELALVDAVGSALNLELALAGSALSLDSALAILVLGTGDVRLGRSAQLRSPHIKI